MTFRLDWLITFPLDRLITFHLDSLITFLLDRLIGLLGFLDRLLLFSQPYLSQVFVFELIFEFIKWRELVIRLPLHVNHRHVVVIIFDEDLISVVNRGEHVLVQLC